MTYPDQWLTGDIQRAQYERAGWRCEVCDMEFVEGTTKARTARNRDGKPTILTVHHINGDKSDVRFENLLVACQACHLRVQALWKPGGVLPADWYPVPQWIVARGLAYRTGPRQLELFEAVAR